MTEERRIKNGGPPTAIAQSWQAMGPQGRRRLRGVGGTVMALSLLFPLVGGLFVELVVYYWIFSAAGFFGGLSLMWPEMGLALIDRVPAGIAKLLPTSLLNRPDKRSTKEGEE